MQVLVLNPETPVEERLVIKDIEGNLESLQENVQGRIEFFTIKIEGQYFDLILHEEGKLEQLPPNIAVFNEGEIIDIIVGNVVIAKADDEGRTIGLTDDEVSLIKTYFEQMPTVVTNNGYELFSYHYPSKAW